MGRRARTVVLVLGGLTALTVLSFWLAGSRTSPRELHILVATSLGRVFDELARELERDRPGVRVVSETGGSLLLARRVQELDVRCDVLALADVEGFDEVLVPSGRVSGYRVLCGNRLGIVHGPSSRHAREIDAQNWHEVLTRPEVRVGRADPDVAPLGYRTLFLFELAEVHLGMPGLAARLRAATPPELVRGNQAALAALVQAGEIDYTFDYESSAVERGLSFLALPREVDQSDPALAPIYARASVEVAGKSPGARRRVRGSTVRYGVAVPRDAREPGLASELLELALGPRGRAVLERGGFLLP